MLNRNLTLIWAGNILLGAAMPTLMLLGGLAGSWLAPSPRLATAPIAAQLFAGMLAATPISLLMGRHGRQSGFLIGAGFMALGGALGAAALIRQDFLLLCLAHVVLGGGLSCANFFRFAAAEAAPDRQARAMSLTLASGIGAALLGPEVFARAHAALEPVPMAGGYLAVAALGGLGALPMLALTLPEPPAASGARRSLAAGFRAIRGSPKLLAAVATAALAQGAMMFLMAPTPMAMIGCGFGEDQAAGAMRWHALAMFGAGFLAGPLIQRFGAGPMALAGLAALAVSGAVNAAGDTLAHFNLALILLGIGWSFGILGGGQMLQEAASPADRPLAQGVNDALMALAGALGALASGLAAAASGWGALVAAVLIALWVVLRTGRRKGRLQTSA